MNRPHLTVLIQHPFSILNGQTVDLCPNNKPAKYRPADWKQSRDTCNFQNRSSRSKPARTPLSLHALVQRLARESRAMNNEDVDARQAATYETGCHRSTGLTRSLQNQADRLSAFFKAQARDIDIPQPCKANQAFTECWESTQSSRHRLDETSPSGNPPTH